MDTETKEQLRFKFYRLALQLNAVILLAALTVMALFIAQEPYRIPLVLVMIVLVVYLSITFKKRYRDTRAWLEEHADKEKDTKKPP
jgi:Ca2+/Na+ antiporter